MPIANKEITSDPERLAMESVVKLTLDGNVKPAGFVVNTDDVADSLQCGGRVGRRPAKLEQSVVELDQVEFWNRLCQSLDESGHVADALGIVTSVSADARQCIRVT